MSYLNYIKDDKDYKKKINEIFEFDICKYIALTDALVAGGFCASLLNSNNTKYGDVDIFVKECDAKILLYILTEYGFSINPDKSYGDKKNSSYKFVNEKIPSYKFVNEEKSRYSNDNVTSRYVMTNKKNLTVDVVVSNVEPINVVKRFDISCCKTFFDGNDLYYTTELTKEGIALVEYKIRRNIIYKEKDELTLKTVSRIIRYMKRGWKFYFYNDDNEAIFDDRLYIALIEYHM